VIFRLLDADQAVGQCRLDHLGIRGISSLVYGHCRAEMLIQLLDGPNQLLTSDQHEAPLSTIGMVAQHWKSLAQFTLGCSITHLLDLCRDPPPAPGGVVPQGTNLQWVVY